MPRRARYGTAVDEPPLLVAAALAGGAASFPTRSRVQRLLVEAYRRHLVSA